MKRLLSILSLAILFAFTGCQLLDPGTSGSTSSGGGQGQSNDDLHVSSTTGIVVRIELQPNDIFWGILADNGTKYEVLNMPLDFRTDGLRVRFEGDIRFVATRSPGYGASLSVSKIEKI